jgi:4-hydroxy-2-oxoglutarate aldolase
MLKLNGIYPPLPTSFDINENLAPDKMRENVRKLSNYDLAGFLVLGSNGELVNLTEKEKLNVYEMARDVIPSNKLMIAGTGGQSTRITIELTKAAANAGTDAVLVLNPSYYKSLMSSTSLTSHYFAVAEASPVPVIIYNMPANSGLDMNADTIIEIATHPNIIGMKDSGGNMVKMGDIRLRVKPEFQILAGSAGFLLPAMSVGAIGGILALANIAPKQCIEIYESFVAGDITKARKMQLEMIPVNDAVTSKWGIPALKEAMDHLGLYGGPSRKPILPVTSDVKSELIHILNKNNIKPQLKTT